MSERNITREYETEALNLFVRWYNEQAGHPTMSAISSQAYIIAREMTNDLSVQSVILFLQEHTDWVYQNPRNIDDGDKRLGLSPGGATRWHLLEHLEKTIQERGIQALIEARVMQSWVKQKEIERIQSNGSG